MGLSKSVVLALAGIILACTACGSSAIQATSTTSTTGPTQPVLDSNGTVTVAVHALPKNFNPATIAGSTSTTAMVMSAVLPQAFLLNGSNAPQCPESVSNVCDGLLAGVDPAELVSNAPQTVVYHIASRATWSDGVPITATDFIYNWKMQLLVGPSLAATDPVLGYEDIASITGSNHGKTVTVVFVHPFADWQSLFSNLIPAHIAKDFAGWNTDFTAFSQKTFVSGGPFVISSVTRGKELVLTRNPHFWGARAGVARIIFRVERTQAAMLRALATGAADLGSLIPSTRVDNTVVTSTNLVESTQVSGILYQLDFNLADPALSDLNLREAIAESIDRHQITSNTAGLLTPFHSISTNHIFPYGLQGSQPNDSTYEQVNLAQAAAQLEQAGYSIGSDGLARSVTGQPLVLSLIGPSGNSIVSSIESEIQAQLLQLGIEVSIENVSSRDLLGKRLPQGTYQMAIAPYFMSPFLSTDAQLYASPVGPVSGAIGTTGSTIPSSSTVLPSSVIPEQESAAVEAGYVTRDVMGYDNVHVSQLFAEASQQLNAGATNTYNQIDAAIWADLPSLPLFQMPMTFVANVRVLNVWNSQGLLGPMWNAQNWTIQSSPTPTTTTTIAN